MANTHHAVVGAALREIVRNDCRLGALVHAAGGSINVCYRAETSRGTFFVKLGGAESGDAFAAEVDGLDSLRRTNTFAVPAVIGTACHDSQHCLVLEHLDLQPLSYRDSGSAAGEALADLHTNTGRHFGWHRDNYLGRTPQTNTPNTYWARFLVENRFAPLLAATNAKGFHTLRGPGKRLLERIPALLVDHHPKAALLHGDLWHGTIACLRDGRPVVFDPAVSYGDAEFDLAMTALFGGFPDSFYAAYRRSNPPSPGHETRAALYRLYHVLNHVVLFGRSYLGEAERTLQKLQR